MIELLREKNKDLKIYSVNDPEFDTFGRIIKDFNSAEIISEAEKIKMPVDGSCYYPSVAAFENTKAYELIKNEFFGSLPTQVGYCYGHSNFLNATEWHFSSEINIAVTPLVLILGHIWDIKNGEIDSSDFKIFYLPAGTVIEVYSTTLHFCPCEVSNNGFGCVVALPEGTNTNLEIEQNNPLLFRKKKWIIAHNENPSLIDRGVTKGISGKNIKIAY